MSQIYVYVCNINELHHDFRQTTLKLQIMTSDFRHFSFIQGAMHGIFSWCGYISKEARSVKLAGFINPTGNRKMT